MLIGIKLRGSLGRVPHMHVLAGNVEQFPAAVFAADRAFPGRISWPAVSKSDSYGSDEQDMWRNQTDLRK